MKKLVATILALGVVMASPASANHFLNSGPYATRGECESRSADLGSDDRESLQARFPNLFSSSGEVMSFLTRAFVCEEEDGDWYLEDHRQEVLDSEWFKRRL